ncbi:hypothetical protein FAES_3189 [Fibrella aestuarina BUZ 2]|uniref:Uncharacterized protein n=1 Tax=Fibrella aestuarina BUZ 2 TaxID=1166018 RepID=I0KAP5_9BACT|nr:hypothetical protein FAES_3189 [Fibrella aestuarina BUZ 2]
MLPPVYTPAATTAVFCSLGATNGTAAAGLSYVTISPRYVIEGLSQPSC